MNLLNDIALFRSLRAEIKYYSKARRVEMTKITKTASPKNKRENIGWRYINNHSDAQRQYILAKKPFSNLFLQMEL